MSEKPIKSPLLVNAVEMARQHPATFSIPDTTRIKPGWLVKVCAASARERFWVQIESVDDKILVGRVDNDLIDTRDIEYNDRIEFHTDNIYAVFVPPPWLLGKEKP